MTNRTVAVAAAQIGPIQRVAVARMVRLPQQAGTVDPPLWRSPVP